MALIAFVAVNLFPDAGVSTIFFGLGSSITGSSTTGSSTGTISLILPFERTLTPDDLDGADGFCGKLAAFAAADKMPISSHS